MFRPGSMGFGVTLLLCAAVGLTAQATFVQDAAQQPAFRSRVTMVPIDVRVMDSNANPITDLKAEDFTVLENGVRQGIRHFSTMALTAETRDPSAAAFEQVLDEPADTFAPQNRRVFLILLGRRQVGALDLAIFVADGRQRGVGELRQTIDLRLRPESVERFLTDGTSVTNRVRLTGEAFYVKAIAYDYGSDLLGTATAKLR